VSPLARAAHFRDRAPWATSTAHECLSLYAAALASATVASVAAAALDATDLAAVVSVPPPRPSPPLWILLRLSRRL